MKIRTASKGIVANVDSNGRMDNWYGLENPVTNAPKHDKSRHADVGTEFIDRRAKAQQAAGEANVASVNASTSAQHKRAAEMHQNAHKAHEEAAAHAPDAASMARHGAMAAHHAGMAMLHQQAHHHR